MSPSGQLTSEQPKEIFEDEKTTANCARAVPQQVDGEEDLDLDNTSSVMNTVLNTINNEFEHECLDDAVGLLNAYPSRDSRDDRVPGQKYLTTACPELSCWRTRFWPYGPS
jgi:hypothetical protein